MNSILRIYVPSTLIVAAQHTEVLIVTLDLTPNRREKMCGGVGESGSQRKDYE